MPQSTPKIGDENFEALRFNKTKIPLPTAKQYSIANFYIALKMIECFQYRPWMSNPNVIGSNGERINFNGEVFTPKFTRMN